MRYPTVEKIIGMDMDKIYLKAEETLEGELGRKPTPEELERKVEDLVSDQGSRDYDRFKDRQKYGE